MLGVGTAQQSRKLQKFWMIAHNGVAFQKVNGILGIEASLIKFCFGDALELKIDSGMIRITKVGHPEYIEHALDGGVYIEAADAEAVLQ